MSAIDFKIFENSNAYFNTIVFKRDLIDFFHPVISSLGFAIDHVWNVVTIFVVCR